jgi:hypothetical protein
VLYGATCIPYLRVNSPSGEVDVGASAVFELQRQVVVCPSLQVVDIMLARLNAHGDTSTQASSTSGVLGSSGMNCPLA